MRTRKRRTAGAAAAAAALAATTLLCAPASGAAPGQTAEAVGTPPPPPARGRALTAVAKVSADRLALADVVAAAKYGTGEPISDPARERVVLDDVAERSAARGVDRRLATAVFRDQIEASKGVQRGLFARWDLYPSERPARRPDLAGEVRPRLDRITVRLLDGLAAAERPRGASSCTPRLMAGAVHEAGERRFDALHTQALLRALPSVCGA
ncbi:chorismate mutase [Streptomyces tubbatahanensis]|uniref:chorismate mutase n=1 Tax=Streptomyces tubbatahanensis TaxID=2923272 RepID=A0ABY3XTU3_9ACTN|nr:chorismate mutase [Streptomyces tubbatahanensis]UNS97833.1 chorismate mutase [Streptomyces tubbatahanensis]